MFADKRRTTTKPRHPSCGNAIRSDRPYLERIRLLLFGISLVVFLFTTAGVALLYCWIMTWPGHGEGGFAVIGALFYLSQLAVIGTVASVVVCGFSVPYFKWAIILFIVELLVLAYFINILGGFYAGDFLVPLP